MSISNQSAIVLVIDQVSASMLGAYGNTSYETGQFNRLAAGSLLFENAFSCSMDLQTTYDQWWGPNQSGLEPFPERLRGLAVDSVLITDDRQVADHSRADFDQVLCLDPAVVDCSAEELTDTQLAQFFAQATAWIEESFTPGSLCWLHSRGLGGAWDAPYSWRQRLAADEDPDPPEFVDSPSSWLDPKSTDPDEVLGIQQAAAAQIGLLDRLLGFLLDTIESLDLESPPLLCVASPRGFAMGEHGLVGPGEQLYNESVQVPLLIGSQKNFPPAMARSQRVVQVDVLTELVENWFSDETTQWMKRIAKWDQVLPQDRSEYTLISSEEHEILHTRAWKLVRSKMGGVELYVKPDDRFEFNDVSDRCSAIVEQMIGVLDSLLRGEPVELAAELVERT